MKFLICLILQSCIFLHFLNKKNNNTIDVNNVNDINNNENNIISKEMEIIKALKESKIDLVNNILNDNPILNLKDIINSFRDERDYYNTLLHFAVKNNNVALVNFLIEKGADVNFENSLGEIPLFLAIKSSNMEIIELLINISYVNSKNSSGFSALHLACQDNHLEIVKKLIEKGAKILKDTEEKTPLHLSVNNKEIMELLINSLDKEELINYINMLNSDLESPLSLATALGNIEVMKLLIKRGASLKNQENFKPIHSAVLANNIEALKLLLQYKEVDINARTQNKMTALHLAAFNNNVEIFHLLVEKEANIDIKNYKDKNVLHIAAIKAKKEIILTLLQINKGYANQKDSSNNVPLHLAFLHSNDEAIKLLIKATDLTIRNEKKETFLHIAVKSKKIDILNLILEKVVNINAQDINGNTALHLAIQCNFSEAIKLLLSLKARIDIENLKQITALQLAKQSENKEILGFFNVK